MFANKIISDLFMENNVGFLFDSGSKGREDFVPESAPAGSEPLVVRHGRGEVLPDSRL